MSSPGLVVRASKSTDSKQQLKLDKNAKRAQAYDSIQWGCGDSHHMELEHHTDSVSRLVSYSDNTLSQNACTGEKIKGQ